MRTLAVMSQKGGTGKTTVAVHLAVAAWAKGQRRVLMADIDPQRSAAEWRRARAGAGPSLIESKPSALFVAQQAAQRAGVDLMIIDTRPAGDGEAAEAIRAADLCLVVLRPSFFDLKTVQRMVDITRAMNKPAVFLLNQVPPRRGEREPPALREAMATLRGRGLTLAPVGLRARVIYQNAVARGLTALDTEPAGAAAREVGLLWAHLAPVLWPSRPVGTPVDYTRLAVARLARVTTGRAGGVAAAE